MIKHIVLALLIAGFGISSHAQKNNADASSSALPKPSDKRQSIADKTKSCKKMDGLFPLFQDTTNGNLYMLVNKKHLGKPFIYFAYTENGVVGAGHFKGSFRDNKLFTINKYFDRVEFTVLNTGFYFDKQSALSKSADANISHATLISQKPLAEDTAKGDMLLDAGSFFMSEAIHQIKPAPLPPPFNSMSLLGNLNKEKSKYIKLRNYEQNTDVLVEYVFDNPTGSALNRGREITDSRAISITLQHSFIEAPANPMKPRKDDPRIGFFNEEVNDMTTTQAVNYKDIIHRWRLEKKDKGAALSEPVKPITWWIENTTPVEFRETIKAAAMQWNIAFEKAGFKNAVVIKEQPDDADWDAGDIRYNVLRWTSSPQPPFGGYGPSFTDPRTGEILGADIMLEYIFVTNRINQEKLFDAGRSASNNEEWVDKHFCSASEAMHLNTLFGLSIIESRGLSEIEKRDYLKQSLYYLVLHEMGHTMGLMHNMKASQLFNPQQLHQKELTQKMGLVGSVMDYPAANIALDKNKQGDYFTTRPGPYDLWAIEYGYSEALDDDNAEEKRLNKILERSTDSTLIFGNDADDMRSPGKAIDPRVNVNDLSNDAISYSVDRIKLVNQLMPKLKEKYSKSGQSYQELRQAYGICMVEWGNAASTISRYIGGVYTNRAFVGQNTTQKPLMPVDIKDQKRAMQSLNTYVFAPNAFASGNELYQYLQLQRRGFNFFGSSEDPKILDRVLMIQGMVLDHVLHPSTLERLSNSRMYGNKYSVSDMMTDLTNGCFREDASSNVNTIRQNLQVEYTTMLARIVDTKAANNRYDYIARSAAIAQLKTIKRLAGTPNPAANAETTAHREHLILLIDRALARE